MSRFYALFAPGTRYEVPVYGRPNDEHRFGKATWDDSMEWEANLFYTDDSHPVFKCHRGLLKIVIPSPAAIGDFVWTWYSECVLTEKVLRLFQGNGFTGFRARQVIVSKIKRKSKKTAEVPPLYELEVYGRGGPPHPDSGSLPLPEWTSLGFPRYSSYKNGLLVNEATWDGTDFFEIEGFRYIIVTERVKNTIVEKKLSNCVLVAVEDMSWPEGIPTPEEQYEEHEKIGPKTDPEIAQRDSKPTSELALSPPMLPLLSKRKRKEARKQIRKDLIEQDGGDDSRIYSSSTDENE